jgi:hypothetical protein
VTRKIGAGVFEIFYAPAGSFANDQAPTATELNDAAVIELTDFLTDGGFSSPFDGSIVDAADMGSGFNKTALGTYGGQPLTAEWYRDFPAASDTAWTTLTRGLAGYFVIARNGLATPGTFAIGDEIESWPIGIASRNPVDVARNDMQRFTNECAVPQVPLEDFAIAA